MEQLYSKLFSILLRKLSFEHELLLVKPDINFLDYCFGNWQ